MGRTRHKEMVMQTLGHAASDCGIDSRVSRFRQNIDASSEIEQNDLTGVDYIAIHIAANVITHVQLPDPNQIRSYNSRNGHMSAARDVSHDSRIELE